MDIMFIIRHEREWKLQSTTDSALSWFSLLILVYKLFCTQETQHPFRYTSEARFSDRFSDIAHPKEAYPRTIYVLHSSTYVRCGTHTTFVLQRTCFQRHSSFRRHTCQEDVALIDPLTIQRNQLEKTRRYLLPTVRTFTNDFGQTTSSHLNSHSCPSDS